MKTNNSPLIGGLFLFPKRITATGTRVAEERTYLKLLHIELQQQVRESLRFLLQIYCFESAEIVLTFYPRMV